ncbi:response regulator [Thermodesulfobacteriota bacterium]
MAEKTPEVLIIENDPETADSIAKALLERGYESVFAKTKSEVMDMIKEKVPGLVIVGNTDDEGSVFDVLKDIVMASPMTSVILVTDISPEEIHEKAEGYGILGHVGRKIDHGELTHLLENFEMITGALPGRE